jgi:hypothetical protein
VLFRSRREAKRCEPATMIGRYLDALGDVAGRRAAGVAEDIFERVGLLDAPRVPMDASSPC